MRAGSYHQGDVFFADIAFSGSVGSKRRPVTNNLSLPARPGDVTLEDWAQAGLLKPSAVRGLVTTIDRNEVVRTLVTLTERDFVGVVRGIETILGLEKKP